MYTLADLTKATRSAVKILVGLSLLFIIVFSLYKGFSFLRNTFFPAPLPPPEEKFGKLPPLSYPAYSGKISYTLNTITGSLPDTPTRISVYTIRKPIVDLLSLDNLRERLANLGYKEEERKISDTKYEWTNPKLGTLVRYDLRNDNFDIISSQSAQEKLAENFGFEKKKLVPLITDFLTLLGLETGDIDFGNSTFSYFTIQEQVMTPAKNPEGSNLVKVDLRQKGVNNHEIYYPSLAGSNMYFEIVSSGDSLYIVSAHFNHSIVNTSSFSSYSIKSSQEAYDDLKSGKGFIFNAGLEAIQILDVSLGYFLNDSDTDFLLPVFVFKGNNFVGYVPAIKN